MAESALGDGSRRRRALAASVLILPTLAALFLIGAVFLRGSARTYSGLLGIAAILGATYVAVWSHLVLNEVAVILQGTVDRFDEVVDNVMPPLAALIAIPPGEKRNGEARRFVSLILALAHQQCGLNPFPRRTIRSVLYSLSPDGMALRRYDSEGFRGDPPRLSFTDSDDDPDRRVVQIARSDEALHEEDIDDQARSYRSRILTPVRTSARKYGILIVDSDIPMSLTSHDVRLLIFLARSLGVALAHLGGYATEFLGHNGAIGDEGVPGVPTQQKRDDTTGKVGSSND
ncbi:GAF domain-containing protein [Virgisporangium aurantiacum]|uniref:GAF domain-containing protein n=1 Tax=Virgisporangium aurantiacum TaxID=175570 RepID=A0A8J3ZFI2_9ACTN|nr:GAF domain-containing protein [Virgisporangium aurantiacum]GIJ63167.1 hypothetical protein Vau01_106830 [Virgisporangium aurantiacum]